MARAWLRYRTGDKPGARKDADAVARVAAKPNDVQFELAQFYDQLGAPSEAIAHYGLWIDAHAKDSRLPEALNNRCWLRALDGHDLDAALDDCDKALRLRPHIAGFLDSRGMVRLRRGDFKKAIDDYDDALKLDPKIATSLYGRGLARRRLGDAKGADKDLAAARAIDPQVADLFNDHGIAR
jgi:tetratricopeptide (TPR) repeat protein